MADDWPMTGLAPLTQSPQRPAFMQGDMRRFIAFNFVLRLIFARVMDIAFVVDVFGVHPHNFPPHPACFRIPAYVIVNFELLGHC
jgi:hypothetical protein